MNNIATPRIKTWDVPLGALIRPVRDVRAVMPGGLYIPATATGIVRKERNRAGFVLVEWLDLEGSYAPDGLAWVDDYTLVVLAEDVGQ